ncbi:MAG TPA: glycoside hydrolase family 2 TIM barrel-domain containing protein [Opitutaceae bacterium]|nr:glycoside hydrolase family 2 TIM barrel-domain containing protein [Opitutaceae bacterium]
MTARYPAFTASALLFAGLLSLAVAAPTEIQMLSGHGPEDAVLWDFFCTGGRKSGEWTKIPVPSCWEQQGFGTYNYGLHHRPGRAGPNPPPLADEQGRYRREFTVPSGWRGRSVRIVFEGAMTDAEVWVNGRSAGPVHQGAFYRFHHDITGLVRFGEANLLEVTVSKKSANESVNRAERIGDYWIFGGIFRPVWLEARPAAAIDWTGIDARADGTFTAEIHLAAPAPAAGTLVAQLFDGAGRPVEPAVVASVPAGATTVPLREVFPGIRTWTAETPDLYRVRFTLALGREQHEVTERFGFRTFEVRPDDGLYLNGRKIILKGVNRHCFRPESGRTLGRDDSYADARLIKEMNMNAVRMSHYPPDKHFLEACDELGLYVLDELAGWQGAYDTPTGARLVGQLVRRDVNHPSILFWDNGNEGGWNTEVDGEFARWDLQRRPVLHPWATFSGVNTDHYEPWDSHVKLSAGPTIYLPTEMLHGLYDGGIGAGLRDYWDVMMRSPTVAGGFFWVFADEGVVRTDEDGRIDNAGNLAPDGIVGPRGEREASFFTVKEIWSPVRMVLPLDARGRLPADWNGVVELVNDHDFSDLRGYALRVSALIFHGPDFRGIPEIYRGETGGTTLPPRTRGSVAFHVPEDLGRFDALRFSVRAPDGRTVWQKTVPIAPAGPDERPAAGPAVEPPADLGPVEVIAMVGKDRGFVPVPLDGEPTFAWSRDDAGGWRLDYAITVAGRFELLGIRFASLPPFTAKRWLGDGPYRVWRNRQEGGEFNVHHVAFKDGVPGETYVYPESAGYFRDWRWLVVHTERGRVTVDNASGVPFFGLGRPPDGVDGLLEFPDVGLAFLHVIPAMRNKFHSTAQLGPQSAPVELTGTIRGTLLFRFD